MLCIVYLMFLTLCILYFKLLYKVRYLYRILKCLLSKAVRYCTFVCKITYFVALPVYFVLSFGVIQRRHKFVLNKGCFRLSLQFAEDIMLSGAVIKLCQICNSWHSQINRLNHPVCSWCEPCSQVGCYIII